MPTDRQRVLLAVLKARGPAHPRSLAYHPVLREHYHLGASHFYIQDDLEALRDAGEVAAHTADVDDEAATVAYDVVGADRPEWDARIERAKDVVREHRRRQDRRERVRSD